RYYNNNCNSTYNGGPKRWAGDNDQVGVVGAYSYALKVPVLPSAAVLPISMRCRSADTGLSAVTGPESNILHQSYAPSSCLALI
ncbi:MAG: hypothetical protein ACFNUQ_10270, partial [Rothia dentocariosa]